ncbi:MAG: ATP-dependent metallopeptidase FtsH/Yme1/Tma family protein, partial [Alphaproteobacteria bacterium]|nr:ATP-dependent metallopeptidase FtsH/Yme1/Tma family protein [Alphaproteobacteria bacterium]
MQAYIRNMVIWGIVAIMLVSLFNMFGNPDNEPRISEMSYSQFLAEVDAGNIASVTITEDAVTGQMANGRNFSTYVPPNDTSL